MIPHGATPIRIEGILPASQVLRTGTNFTAVVQGSVETPFITLAGTRVPLPSHEILIPGQQVRVDILPGANTPTIQITALTQDAPLLPRMPNIEQLIAPVLARYGVSTSPSAARLVPPAMPLTPQQLHQLLSVFFEQSRLSNDLQQLSALLSRFSEQFPDLAAAAQFFSARAGVLTAGTTQEWRQLLSRSASDHALEARIAAAIAEGRISEIPTFLQENLRAQLALLRGNQALATHLREHNQHQEFDELLTRLTDRLNGGELQKLRALNQGYHFIELPTSSDAEVRRGHIHFFSEDPAGQKSSRQFRVVLDLELSNIGPMWIILQASSTHCSCQFQSSLAEVRTAIEEARDEIENGLRSAGYNNTQVTATGWDGDRIAGIAALMDGLTGLRLEG